MEGQPKHRTTPASQHRCPSCRRPVKSVVERHRNMGVYVPRWTAGPCHNPRCERYVSEQVTIDSVRGATWRRLTDWKHH
ncbi:hypothetical protein AB0F77_27745 [Streptomyces sp. NPDC026672]|uniref:hypothetical protein n=1 Tax=unclassified Streptomyces TaxID=2593676 RepID=UPI0034089DE8